MNAVDKKALELFGVVINRKPRNSDNYDSWINYQEGWRCLARRWLRTEKRIDYLTQRYEIPSALRSAKKLFLNCCKEEAKKVRVK